jgi:hypothetical protein
VALCVKPCGSLWFSVVNFLMKEYLKINTFFTTEESRDNAEDHRVIPLIPPGVSNKNKIFV